MTKNYGNYKTKSLVVKKLGWKRIARNTQRFGWILGDATEHTEITETTTYEGKVVGDTIYINPRTGRTSKTRVWLSFYRAEKVSAGVGVLEFFYNLLFLIRRILGFCLPIAFVGVIVLMLLGGADLCLAVIPWVIGGFFAWIFCIIFEGVFSRIAGAILKRGRNVKKSAVKSNGYVSDYAFIPPENDRDSISLVDKSGREIEFYEVAGIFYKGNSYAILQPVELLEDMAENEALVFKVTRDGNGDNKFEVELNDKVIDAVFAEYHKILDEAERKAK